MSHILSIEDLSDKKCHVEISVINSTSLYYHSGYSNEVCSHCSVAVMSLYSTGERARSSGKYGLAQYHSF
jgi:hypothetical protein